MNELTLFYLSLGMCCEDDSLKMGTFEFIIFFDIYFEIIWRKVR